MGGGGGGEEDEETDFLDLLNAAEGEIHGGRSSFGEDFVTVDGEKHAKEFPIFFLLSLSLSLSRYLQQANGFCFVFLDTDL